MQNLKDKMYNYEVTPPSESWQVIATALDENKTADSRTYKKPSKIFYLSLSAAAAIAIFVFGLIFLGDNIGKKASEAATTDDKITVPKTTPEEVSAGKSGLGKNSTKLRDATSESDSKKYITITSPQGECVKISSKAAMLIVSSDDQNPPKPVWSAKVNKWRDIMKNNILAPTTANFLDIVELTHALRIDN